MVAAARYSFTGPLVPLISPGLSLSYWDYQVRADRNFGRLRLTLLAFGSEDTMSSTGGAPPYGDFLDGLSPGQSARAYAGR